jgi:hypothetical protein
MDYKQQQCCKAIITRISVIKHQRMDSFEARAAHADMQDALLTADQLGISWILQNALLYIGEKYDVRCFYLDDLLRMACERASCPA